MKNKMLMKRLLKLFTALLMVLMPLSVLAESIDTTQTVTVTLKYDPDGFKSLDGAKFKIYKVADVSANGTITVVAGLNDANVNTEKMDAAEAARLAGILKDATADHTATISDGVAVISDLPVGVYLLVGEETKVDKKTYTPTPSFFSIPQKIDHAYSYEPFNVEVKYTFKEEPPSEETVSYKVIKKWAGDNEKIRPAEITVAIIEGSTQKETVVLNKTNNWTYEWTGKKDIVYRVVEKNIPEGYSVTQTGTTTEFILTNTYHSETPPPATTPPTPTAPPENPPGSPPNTGDYTDLRKMGMLLGGSLIVIAATGILLTKNKE